MVTKGKPTTSKQLSAPAPEDIKRAIENAPMKVEGSAVEYDTGRKPGRAKPRPMVVNLTRGRSGTYYLTEVTDESYIICFCSQEFHRVTRVRLRMGQSKKVRIIIEEVKE